MHFSTVFVALSAAAITSATLTFNLTSALQPGNFAKYRCLDNAKLLGLFPKDTAQCLAKCQATANKADGCAEDDFACHCVNYWVYSKAIEPCAFSTGCDPSVVRKAQPVVTDMCNFFNATLYADYVGCRQKLSKMKTLDIVAHEDIVVSH